MEHMIAPSEDAQRFSADAAHELRTPIAASKILAQLALGSQDIHRCHEFLEDILKGLDRASHIIAQIQLLTGIRPEQVLKSRADIPLRPMLATLSRDLTLITNKKVQIDNLIPEDLTVFANEGCMLIVLRNVLDNAIRYAGDEPRMTVTAEQVGGRVQIAVVDQGPGIPPELRTRVLDRFYREPSTDQTGSGLGLSIVAQICEIHGGSITLHDGDAGIGLKVVILL